MIAYIDSSVLMQNILTNDIALYHALEYKNVYASEILFTECSRVLHRMSQIRQLDDVSLALSRKRSHEIINSIHLIPLNDSIKQRAAEAFPSVIGTLDALHLASALALQEYTKESVSIFSYDKQLNVCAVSCGLHTPLCEI